MPSLRHYGALFNKQAQQDLKPLDNTVDSSEVANAEHDRNIQDSRASLMDLFSHASLSSKEQTKQFKSLLKMDGDVDTSNPLLKVAGLVLRHGHYAAGLLKTASPAYLQVASLAFDDELQKIAASLRGAGDFMDSARRAAKFVEPHARDAAKATGDAIKKHPYISTAAGFTAGAALGHRHGRNEEREAHKEYSRDGGYY